MLEQIKQKLLTKTRDHISHVRQEITADIARREAKGTVMKRGAISMLAGDALAQRQLAAHNDTRVEDLKQLYPSPYFTRCEFEINGEIKNYYFGKFSFNEEKIYSWITPAAALRYENIGPAGYTRPDGQRQSGRLLSKDQYLIVDGKLLFYTTEDTKNSRELIYQENFTRKKSGFILPEVVEQMEKAQDQVVRAPHLGPLLISGPAGSGKTTLALHRVAYLMQSPETASIFNPNSVLVLVQDSGTKEYFSHLLPELGIRGVEIITFGQWAASALGLDSEYKLDAEFQIDGPDGVLYEYAKLAALRGLSANLVFNKNIWRVLGDVYQNVFNQKLSKIFSTQKEKRALDRFDLTILLRIFLNTKSEFTTIKEFYEESARGTYRKKRASFKMEYNLMIIDEFQNYLPEQLLILKTCLNHRLDSVVYVGDLAQQTRLGTVRDWASVGEKIIDERLITLQKVYRNTKQILAFISRLGYDVKIPDGLKDGKEVSEYVAENKIEEIARAREILKNVNDGTLGILAKDKNYLEEFKQEFKNNPSVHCLSMYEAQGVEFEAVCIVGVSAELFAIGDLSPEKTAEVKKVQRDLLYVALTRAISELHVIGDGKLSDIYKILA